MTSTNTKTHTPTLTETPTNTLTLTPTATKTPTYTVSYTPTVTDTPTPSYTSTSTSTVTNTPTITRTRTPSRTRTLTRTKTLTPVCTATPTITLSLTATSTVTQTPGITSTPTRTRTSTRTRTFTRTLTNTRTVTPTWTATVTDTPLSTATPSVIRTLTKTATPQPTVTQIPLPTATWTPTSVLTQTPNWTPTQASTNTQTPLPTMSRTPTRTPTSATGDKDGDGVLNAIEAKVNDGNGDYLPDQWQANVASFLSATNTGYLTLAAPQTSSLKEVTPINFSDLHQMLLGVTFPVGLVQYTVKCPTTGMKQSLTLYLPKGITVTGFMNCGPTAGDTDPHLYSFLLTDGLGAVMGSKTVTLYLQDGGWGDNDLKQNGQIEFLGGPTQPVVYNREAEAGEEITPLDATGEASLIENWMNYE